MTNKTKLPDGLSIAVALLAQIGDESSDAAIAAVRELIAAALEAARCEGAEAMRAESAKLARALPLYYGSGDEGADESLAQAIEDLPLPAAKEQS